MARSEAFGGEIWAAGLGIRALARYVKVGAPSLEAEIDSPVRVRPGKSGAQSPVASFASPTATEGMKRKQQAFRESIEPRKHYNVVGAEIVRLVEGNR